MHGWLHDQVQGETLEVQGETLDQFHLPLQLPPFHPRDQISFPDPPGAVRSDYWGEIH